MQSLNITAGVQGVYSLLSEIFTWINVQKNVQKNKNARLFVFCGNLISQLSLKSIIHGRQKKKKKKKKEKKGKQTNKQTKDKIYIIVIYLQYNLVQR